MPDWLPGHAGHDGHNVQDDHDEYDDSAYSPLLRGRWDLHLLRLRVWCRVTTLAIHVLCGRSERAGDPILPLVVYHSMDLKGRYQTGRSEDDRQSDFQLDHLFRVIVWYVGQTRDPRRRPGRSIRRVLEVPRY